MFGFIRPVKSELKVKEADRFQQVYCGLCHAIRARYGRFYTMFLSYDMTFYALVVGSGEVSDSPGRNGGAATRIRLQNGVRRTGGRTGACGGRERSAELS